MERSIICCDMKSFYASVECVDRGEDPLNTNLVVADPTRSDKTICLAVSPALKSFGIPGRPRLFEVIQKVTEINAHRQYEYQRQHAQKGRTANAPDKDAATSVYASELNANPALKLDYITAPPRMTRYMEVSNQIYGIFLRYIAPEDILVYSVDEAFMDVTAYLSTYRMTAHELAMTIIRDVLATTGITSTIGIGTNLYLGKVAMDIVAKKMPPDKDGVRIAELDELSYRKLLWSHKPLTDFWRIGPGYARKLNQMGLYTMGDIARCSCGKKSDYFNEDLLFKAFGINAELLIDHAWGNEPCTMEYAKKYKPSTKCLSSGQVLPEPYDYDKARLIVKEMADQLSLEMTRKNVLTNQMTLTIGYDVICMEHGYKGAVSKDYLGRIHPKHSHGTYNFESYTNLTTEFTAAADDLFLRLMHPGMYVRRIGINVNNVLSEAKAREKEAYQQLDLFTDFDALRRKQEQKERALSLQRAIVSVHDRYGKNALIKGMDLLDGARTIERNGQVGGHRA